MVVYDVRLSRALVGVTSRVQLQQQLSAHPHHYEAVGLMLTSGLELMVCVDRGRVVIWRLATSGGRVRNRANAYDKYSNDDAPADDEDDDFYLYDDISQCTDDTQQVVASDRRLAKRIGTKRTCVRATVA